MIRAAISVILIVSAMFFTSCATIMQGTTQAVGIVSTPTGASITVDGVNYGKTPLTADLKRKDNHIIKIELPGYQPYETTLTRSVSGWVWGNIVVGGLPGLVIDAISGGLYKLTPVQIMATLQKQGAGLKLREDTLYIAVALTSDPDWQKIGNLTPEK